jgi:glycosyltransferase involved in cell wall biosynthesis
MVIALKVAIVNSFYPPWRGGAETYTYNLARGLVDRGSQVTVICAAKPEVPGEYERDGVKIRRLRTLGRLYGTPILPTLFPELCRIDADIFHANFPSPYIAFTVALVCTLRSKKAVLTWHNDLPPVAFGARMLIEIHDRLILPSYLHAYRRIIATSQAYVENSRILRKLEESQGAVIPNGVDCERFHPNIDATELRQKLNIGGRFVLLFVGALTKWHRYKGLDILLQSLRMAVDQDPDISLVIVGDGDLRNEYQRMSEELRLEENVVFAGDVSDDELPRHYALADALVLPSKDMSEGFGLTLLEANASGKPVIASRVGGIPSVVRDGYNGFLVPPNQAEQLAQAILRLKGNPGQSEEMGRNGRAVAELHDWKLVATQTEKVYLDVLSHP